MRERRAALRTYFLPALLFLEVLGAWARPLEAGPVPTFSGKLSEEGGAYLPADRSLQAYQITRLFLQSRTDLAPFLSLDLAGEVFFQVSTGPLAPSWVWGSPGNALELSGECGDTASSRDLRAYRLSRANLRFASGPLETVAGLQAFPWGSSRFYRPTDFFSPMGPLDWEREEALASEGLDASCFLVDDLTLEGAVRFLGGNGTEGVLRLVNKGIGLTATPSFARMAGRDGVGWEISGTFPDFQARVEGVAWLYPGGGAQAEWTAGVSTVRSGATYSLELFRDGTGRVLGPGSASYLFTSMEKVFEGEWRLTPALVKSLEGGPLLFWPKVSWGFSTGWTLAFQGQWRAGSAGGPLSGRTDRMGLSLAYIF